ncbi:MAG: hypothetical protein Q8N49_01315 [Candidatus Omnitrophota bacterium]|nr:hypothetical protein [Candidatus Omnitrophota bacterium]
MIDCKKNGHYYKDYYEDKQKLPEHLIWTIEGIPQRYKACSVLEVGCGTGHLLHFLNSKDHSAYGYDISFMRLKKQARLMLMPYIFLSKMGAWMP